MSIVTRMDQYASSKPMSLLDALDSSFLSDTQTSPLTTPQRGDALPILKDHNAEASSSSSGKKVARMLELARAAQGDQMILSSSQACEFPVLNLHTFDQPTSTLSYSKRRKFPFRALCKHKNRSGPLDFRAQL